HTGSAEVDVSGPSERGKADAQPLDGLLHRDHARKLTAPGANRHSEQPGPRLVGGSRAAPRCSQVLPGVGSGVDGPSGLLVLAADQRADVDDPLTLLTGDASPVVRVG